MPASGSGELTGQSEPKLSLGPRARSVDHGYCPEAPGSPNIGPVTASLTSAG